MHKPHLVVLGRQGAGKGTQCERLASAYDIAHLSTGHLFREAARDGSSIGRRVRPLLEAGALVPDELVLEVVANHLSRHGLVAGGFVLDGFPRTLAQAVAAFGDGVPLADGDRLVAGAADRLGCSIDLAIELAVPTSVVLVRLAARRVCPVCGATVTVAAPSIAVAPCPNGHGPAVRRKDDSDEAIQRRLQLYERETAPVAAWFAARDLLARIDGVGDADEVFDRICAVVGPRLEPAPTAA